jgi:hypothetical protein
MVDLLVDLLVDFNLLLYLCESLDINVDMPHICESAVSRWTMGTRFSSRGLREAFTPTTAFIIGMVSFPWRQCLQCSPFMKVQGHVFRALVQMSILWAPHLLGP